MGKLYAIALIKKVDLRETRLLQIFSKEDYGSVYTGPYIFILNKNERTVNTSLSLTSIKTYKTINGAQKFIDIWTKTFDSKSIRINNGYSIDGKWTFYLTFNSEYSLVIVDITEKWNTLIDKDIYDIKLRMERKINTLNKKKV